MSTRYHVYASDDFVPDEGGSFDHQKTYADMDEALERARVEMNLGRAVQIEPETLQ